MSVRKSEARAGLLFASPWLIGFVVFLAYPLGMSIYYSFCEFSVLKPPIWVGLENYIDLFEDKIFWQTIYNTLYYTVVALPLGTIVSISLALLLNSKVKGQPIYRTIFYLPSLVPQVALAMLWMWMFNGEHGLLNIGLGHLGIKGPPWMSSPDWSKPALIFMSLWTGGNAIVIYLASLQDVPQELVEAADLDGASPIDKLRNVTLPMISPVILFNAIMLMLGSLQIFAGPYIMFPGGAPARSTYFYVMYLFDNAFVYHKFGYACAMGWIMFIIVMALTFTALKMSEKRVYYGGG